MGKKGDSKRIVFLIGCMGRGGAERVISVLANTYALQGWQVDILMLLEDRVEYELDENINTIFVGNKSVSRIRQIPIWINSIRRHIKENNPERIVSFIARINIITILSCLGLNKHIIISERNDPRADGRSILTKISTYLLYPLAKNIVFQTKWAQDCFPKNIKKKSFIIPNPICVTTKIAESKEKKIVAVGRLIEQKNHKMLIDAFKIISEKYSQYKLYIYGEGRLRKKLETQIKDLNLSNNVFLPGNVTNVHEEISDAEIFVLSSNYEGLSNALLEAMMMGLPCITTNCSGVSEIIKNDYNGLLIPINNQDKLVEALDKLIQDKAFANTISKNSLISSNEYKAEKVFKCWANIISEIN